MRDARIAMVICQAPVGAVEENLGRARMWTEKASAAGAELICFPELSITGYTTRQSLTDLAQPIPGPVTETLAQQSVRNRIVILAGLVEHNPAGRPFATHGVFHPDGRVEYYRKLHLAPPEKAIFNSGNTIPVFQTGTFIFGVQLCYDSHFPELATAMAALGADIIFMPHASPRGAAAEKHESWLRHLPARAFDNGVFIAACNQWGSNGRGLSFPGNAMVIGPDGKVLEKLVSGKAEAILIADLKAADLDAVRSHPMRYFFPHRRLDLFGINRF